MEYDPERITFFARTDARGKNVPFGIKAKDRSKHMYVIGKTGMGKSTLLENMAIQDIQNGEGIAFIDPHGSTAEKLLEYVPPERIKDVLYFAPFDMDYPVSFNVMEDVGYDRRHLVVSGLMSTFKKIWVDAWSARMEYILSNTLLALLEYPGSTLLGVNRMLSDKAYRDMVVDNVSDPSVKSFWVDEFAKYNERYMQEAGDAIKNKIGQFTANPLIRNIIGQPKSSFDVRQMMDERKILIINLSKGLVGETNANLLGSMMITRIYLSAMSRANLSASEIAKAAQFYFYVDEFQSFANETFASILSEARKYKLNLTIAHQYIEQMEEEVRDAVFGNVGTTIAFRVGPLDAEFLEAIFTPTFLAPDIVNLGFAQIYLSLMIDGIGSRPFSAVTLPPIEQSHVSCKDQIIASSRRMFAHPRAEVEAAIHAWHAPIQKAAPVRAEKAPEKKMVAPRPVPVEKRPASQSAMPEARIHAEDTPLETPRQKQKEPTRQKADLTDLRSVLRSISEKESKPKDVQKPREHKEKKKSESAQDLKSALAEVLKSHTSRQADTAPVTTPTDLPASRKGTSVEERPEGISQKQLERMLRLTGKDNPPHRL
jgi:energy-coupling factor transporter ATP-binding protein EcfA2